VATANRNPEIPLLTGLMSAFQIAPGLVRRRCGLQFAGRTSPSARAVVPHQGGFCQVALCSSIGRFLL